MDIVRHHVKIYPPSRCCRFFIGHSIGRDFHFIMFLLVFFAFPPPSSLSLSLSLFLLLLFSGDLLIFPPCSIEQLELVISRTATRMDSRFPWPEHQIFNIVPLCGCRTIEICWLESVIIIAVVVLAWKERAIFKRIVERYRAWIWRFLSGFCETAI